MSHHRFSPSSADRWVVCQESVLPLDAEHYIANDDTEYSKDGSAKHALSDWALRNDCDTFDALLAEMAFHGLQVTTEMMEAADVYVHHIRELIRNDPTLIHHWYEERVYVHDVQDGMYGQLDCALYSEEKKHLKLRDAKFGWETIDVETWQLRVYAVGKVRELEDLGLEVETVEVGVVQPLDKWEPIKVKTYTRDQIKRFARQLKKATTGSAVKAGNHCHRCKRAHVCQTYDDFVADIANEALTNSPADVQRLVAAKTPEQIAALLAQEDAVTRYFSALKGWAKQLIMLGQEVPGWHLKGGLTHRYYRDPAIAERVLHTRYGDGIYEPKTLRSPAQIEGIWKDAAALMKGTDEQPGLTARDPLGLKLVKKER